MAALELAIEIRSWIGRRRFRDGRKLQRSGHAEACPSGGTCFRRSITAGLRLYGRGICSEKFNRSVSLFIQCIRIGLRTKTSGFEMTATLGLAFAMTRRIETPF